MSAIVLAVPYVPPPPPVPPFTGFEHTWTGWDGSHWSLSDPDGGVVLVSGGVVGMNMPTFDHYSSESPALAGARHRGSRAQVREPEWPLLVYSDKGSEDWLERDRAFWRTMHPDRPGVWTVTNPRTGEHRSLMCRFYDDGSHAFDLDPAEAGWALYSLTLRADQPYWLGEWVSSPLWGTPVSTDFIPPGGAPPFNISSGMALASAELTNPGDVAAWPTWTITGPFSSITLSTAGGTVGIPGGVASGQTLTVHTDPRDQAALLGGVDVTGTVDFDPRPIPAGESSPVEVEFAGSGSVQAAFMPRYFRAF